MYLLIALLFGILYGVITGLGIWMGAGSAIDYDELMELRQKEVKLSKSQKLMEIFTTHPNMLKRIKHLSTLTV
jgi:cell fate (sporulation/competence/biofilm development) regulator YlbF (YheA/YmcA/DUF963 family)